LRLLGPVFTPSGVALRAGLRRKIVRKIRLRRNLSEAILEVRLDRFDAVATASFRRRLLVRRRIHIGVECVYAWFS